MFDINSKSGLLVIVGSGERIGSIQFLNRILANMLDMNEDRMIGRNLGFMLPQVID
jgi:hypothetical protein